MNDASIAEILRDTRTDLAADNAKAAQVEAKREWAALGNMLTAFGLCNVVSYITEWARDREDEAEGGKDYAFAAEVLEAASAAVDLPYSVRNIRPETLAVLRDAVAGIQA